MITAQIIGKEQFISRFAAMPENLHDELKRRITTLSLQMEAHVKNDKLSGQVLNSLTGALKRSIQSDVMDGGDVITGRVYSAAPMPYARIHEYGGKTKAHIIEAINGQALRFEIGGKVIYRKSVNHPGSTMPERSYLRSSLEDYRENIIQSFKDAVKVVAK